MPGNGHVRFGGRIEETDRWKRRHRASVRPYAEAVSSQWSDGRAGGRESAVCGRVLIE